MKSIMTKIIRIIFWLCIAGIAMYLQVKYVRELIAYKREVEGR